MKLWIMSIILFSGSTMAQAETADTNLVLNQAAQLANQLIIEVRRTGENPTTCRLSLEEDEQSSQPRFVSGIAPCGASPGSGWSAVAHDLGQFYDPQEVNRRNRAFRQEHQIGINPRGEVRLGQNHIIQITENAGANIFLPLERVECIPQAVQQTSDQTRVFRHPISGETTAMNEGVIRYYLPGRDEPIEKRWNFSTFNQKCTQLLTQQASGEGEQNGHPLGLCMAFHQASPSNFRADVPRPNYYCMVNTFLQNERDCVGLDQSTAGQSQPIDKGDEEVELDPQKELQGNGGRVCCGGWNPEQGRSCSLCTTNGAEGFGFRNIFEANSQGSDPTFHVVECIGPNNKNDYHWGETLTIRRCQNSDPCCDINRYDDSSLVQQCLRRLAWQEGACREDGDDQETE